VLVLALVLCTVAALDGALTDEVVAGSLVFWP
jgi:hypothetical protein